ncbi:MAG: hypothetical protein DI535_20790 [Citrobacter freundii]|nr:MAG: hypothetical protein DI535_20790 [Citrobacter freundii]
MNIIFALLVPVGYFIFIVIRTVVRRKHAGKRKRRLARTYNGFVLREGMIIDHSEVIGDMVIALNRCWKELVVIDQHGKIPETHRIRLSTVTDCLIKEERYDRGNLKEIQLLLFRRNNQEPVIVHFRASDNTMTEEQSMLKKARRWKNLVDVHRWVVSV